MTVIYRVYPPEPDSIASNNMFDKNVAELHDWLKLMEQKVKAHVVVVGDPDDMGTARQKQTVSLKVSMVAKLCFLDNIKRWYDVVLFFFDNVKNYVLP